MDNHSREWCYIDPRSKVYKPEVRERRLAQAKAKGVKIPQWILDMDKGKGKINYVQDAYQQV